MRAEPLRGRAPVGERLYGTAPFGKWGTQTFVAGLTQDALIAPWVINGAMNRAAFDAYVETQLAPVLDPGTVVILDNLSTHKSPRAVEAMRKRNGWFLFLPAYSPNLNPIKMAFSKLKAHLRRIGARTFDALFEPLADICDLFDPDECWNFLKAAGYASNQMLNVLVTAFEPKGESRRTVPPRPMPCVIIRRRPPLRFSFSRQP